MSCNLLELPRDVLRDTWRYLSLIDVIRFGMTAKNMLDLTWSFFQEITIDREWPLAVLSFVLSRDLSQIRNADLYYAPPDQNLRRESDNTISSLEKQLDSLKLSKLSNLHTLTTDIKYNDATLNNSLNDFISNNTQLQSLSWYSADVEQNFNIGQFFINHTRLTSLTIQTGNKLKGTNLLTQLRELVSPCDNLDDHTLADMMTLTQLKILNIGWNDFITDESFTKITNLTHLEQLDVQHTHGIKSTSLNALCSLPKLSKLTVNYPYDIDVNQVLSDATIIGKLSNLTTLRF
eukprot:TRINITY_DN5608_c0_g1_i2.p1 TRINITY_DN5608_c0_g1~~TRINITY_DN5608_c0_g1_i2.p1  ORF type:complete len:291 (+),score=25.62 TRINITY_DN5608_c0_g1_i2:53-925(+)